MKANKTDILVDVVQAIYNKNNEVRIETTDAQYYKTEQAWHAYNPKIKNYIAPDRHTMTYNNNLKHAKSFTVGSDISIKKQNGYDYTIRTPRGIITIQQTDIDLRSVLWMMFDRYFNRLGQSRLLIHGINNKVHKAIFDTPVTEKENITKQQKSINRLQTLGVPTAGLQQRINNANQR